jgi:glyoxylase-like metal-dependent hydrolase (beta-lactamase superfamily II)
MNKLIHLIATAVIGTATISSQAADVTPVHTEQAPGFFRQSVGTATVTALYDGYIGLTPTLLKGMSATDIQTLLAKMFQKSDNGIQTAVNAYLVHTGKELVLVDAGAAKCFGPTMGNIVANIKAAGYQPDDIDTVLLTHMHPDHICGLVDAGGKAVFPRATVWGAKSEAAFWLDKNIEQAAPEGNRPFFEMAQHAIAPYAQAGRFRTFAPGESLPAGFTVMPSAGHTPGHTSYLLTSANESLLIWGDIIHAHAVQLAHPEVAIEFDVTPTQAIASRKAILEQVATQRLMIAGAHMPFPGMGHLHKDANGYSWVPVEFAPLTKPVPTK